MLSTTALRSDRRGIPIAVSSVSSRSPPLLLPPSRSAQPSPLPEPPPPPPPPSPRLLTFDSFFLFLCLWWAGGERRRQEGQRSAAIRNYLFPRPKGHLEVPAVPAKGRGPSQFRWPWLLSRDTDAPAHDIAHRSKKIFFPAQGGTFRFPRFPQSAFGPPDFRTRGHLVSRRRPSARN